jgi:alpha-glucoside transport system permease protein
VDASRLLSLGVVVIGVPLVLVGYILATEWALGLLPERQRPRLRPWLWVLPALALVAAFLVYPSLDTIRISFFNFDSSKFVGLANYQWLIGSDAARNALRNNVLWVVVYTGFVLVFGLAFAVLADRVSYEGVTKSLVFLPMAISFVAAGVIWRFMYAYQPAGAEQTGVVNAFVTTLGAEPQAWLINAPWNTFALIVAAVWVWTGFAMVILSAALKGIPQELIEAARVDGAGELLVFRRIILPLLGPTIAVILTTLVIFALKAFDIVYVMTSGNYDTNVIALLMYQQMFTVRDFGHAAAVSVLLLAAVVPVLIVNLRRFRFQEAIR